MSLRERGERAQEILGGQQVAGLRDGPSVLDFGLMQMVINMGSGGLSNGPPSILGTIFFLQNLCLQWKLVFLSKDIKHISYMCDLDTSDLNFKLRK